MNKLIEYTIAIEVETIIKLANTLDIKLNHQQSDNLHHKFFIESNEDKDIDKLSELINIMVMDSKIFNSKNVLLLMGILSLYYHPLLKKSDTKLHHQYNEIRLIDFKRDLDKAVKEKNYILAGELQRKIQNLTI